MLVVITGISGSGKDTLGSYLSEYGITKLVSYTTREIREGETDGVDYHFLNMGEYENLNKANNVQYAGNYYSFSEEDIVALSGDTYKYSVVNQNGLEYFKENVSNIIHVHMKVSIEDAVKRMEQRGDTKESIQSRINYYNETEKHIVNKMESIADYVLEGILEEYKHFAKELSVKVKNK